jgi:erythromycin esterase-like protein
MDWSLEANGGTQANDATTEATSSPLPLPERRSSVSHRKNPSDTFAWAAVQLLDQSPDDLLDLLAAERQDRARGSPFQGILGDASITVSKLDDVQQQQQQQSMQTQHTVQLSASSAAATTTTTTTATAARQGTGTSVSGLAHAGDPDAAALTDHGGAQHAGHDLSSLDPRRAKRIQANRQSAQRSRMKRLAHIHELEERSATVAQTVRELRGQAQAAVHACDTLSIEVEASRAEVRPAEHDLARQYVWLLYNAPSRHLCLHGRRRIIIGVPASL